MTDAPSAEVEVIWFRPGTGRTALGGASPRTPMTSPARVEGDDLDRRVVHLRQGRRRAALVGDRPHEGRPTMRSEVATGRRMSAATGSRASPTGVLSAFCVVTFEPFCSLSTPSVTTRSPADTPWRTARSPLCCGTSTERIETVPSLRGDVPTALRRALDRGGRHDHDARCRSAGGRSRTGSGKSAPLWLSKGFRADGASARIDLVIDGQELAVLGFVLRSRSHASTTSHAAAQLREDRLQAVLGGVKSTAIGSSCVRTTMPPVSGVDHVARVDLAQAGAAGDRRGDLRVGQVEARAAVGEALVRLDTLPPALRARRASNCDCGIRPSFTRFLNRS